jgi:tRNA nucleotidyltransferase (CCA-adding enzyme)
MTTTITLPEKVTQIINQLEAAGFESYAVGGCIRDTLLCTPPSDWDITTSATPTQVKSIFPHTIDTGIQHGTVTVLLPQKPTSHEQSTHYVGFEVTTYRIDGKYEDSRHPKEVTFTPNLSEDLKRRDFTINAMAYNEKNGLIDLYGGINDLNNRIIRCVGNPEERFTEDALRILRALRFSAQLTFTIDNDTRQAMAHLAPNLQKNKCRTNPNRTSKAANLPQSRIYKASLHPRHYKDNTSGIRHRLCHPPKQPTPHV